MLQELELSHLNIQMQQVVKLDFLKLFLILNLSGSWKNLQLLNQTFH